MVELEVVDVGIDETVKSPFVELRTRDDRRRLLPIFIGIAEASAIKNGIEERSTPRPLTHDLIGLLLDATGTTLDQVVISSYRKKIFYADLHLSRGVERITVSCRPSDAIAVAVRRKVSVFANDDVIEECSVTDLAEETDLPAGKSSEHLFDEFRRFIDDINPDDFNAP